MEDNFRLTVKPSIRNYINRVDDVENMVKEIINSAMVDFLMVSELIKKYNKSAKSAIADFESLKFSLSVKELQYMDVFSQKLNHIVQLNKILTDDNVEGLRENDQADSNCDHANFIFKLNYFQATIAGHDFTTTAAHLKQNLHDLQQHIGDITMQDFQENDYFGHLEEIETKINNLVNTLGQLAKERLAESSLQKLVKEQGVKVEKIYTMDSERQVLEWLLNNLNGKAEEMAEAYRNNNFGHSGDDIELF